MPAKVSVVVVNYNGGAHLERSLNTLVNQQVQAQEIILVDNASTDGSLAIAQSFPQVRVIKLDRNLGFAAANNRAIEAASPSSQWIALVNPDAFLDSDCLSWLLDAARRNPDFDAFGCKLVDAADPSRLDGVGDVYHFSGLFWRKWHGQDANRARDQREQEIFCPCAAAALYSRQAIEQVGGFDEDFFCYAEDVDLGFRLRLAGYRSLYVPAAVARHVGSATSGGKRSEFAVYHGHRNLTWTFFKNMPGFLFWLLLPTHVVLTLVSILWLARRGQGRVILRAKRDAISGLGRMWAKRRVIQANRVVSPGSIWRQLDKRLLITSRHA